VPEVRTSVKRDLILRQKRPNIHAKETSYRGRRGKKDERGLLECLRSSSKVSKET
jgi:hypothetical protein